MGLLTLIISKGAMESKLVFEAKMSTINNYKKNLVVQRTAAGTIQENRKATDCHGNNFSREKS